MRTAAMTVAFLLVHVASTFTAAPIRFVHPKRTVLVAGPGGTEIPVQTLIQRSDQNRAFRLEWGGEFCGGSTTRELDGEGSSGLQPIEPLKVRIGGGVCVFAAAVYGPSGQILARTQIEVRVCGAADECG